MLLRRFSKHVSDQNWFAVGLDVIVVVVGIFSVCKSLSGTMIEKPY